jgi:hypothetical protein
MMVLVIMLMKVIILIQMKTNNVSGVRNGCLGKNILFSTT